MKNYACCMLLVQGLIIFRVCLPGSFLFFTFAIYETTRNGLSIFIMLIYLRITETNYTKDKNRKTFSFVYVLYRLVTEMFKENYAYNVTYNSTFRYDRIY